MIIQETQQLQNTPVKSRRGGGGGEKGLASTRQVSMGVGSRKFLINLVPSAFTLASLAREKALETRLVSYPGMCWATGQNSHA